VITGRVTLLTPVRSKYTAKNTKRFLVSSSKFWLHPGCEHFITFTHFPYYVSSLLPCAKLMPSPSCVSMNPLHITFRMSEPIFMKLRMCVMAPEPISPISLCVCVSLLSLQGNGSVKCIPPFGARQRLGKHVQQQQIYATREELMAAPFFAIRALSKDSLWVCVSLYHC
jgi:hypothetical protein